MSLTSDVLVVGLGATGSATALASARRGLRVIGVDRHSPPHTLGSSHGHTRIIRQAYYEDPAYVPLVLHAYEGWAALEHDSGRPLLRQTGGLMLGRPDGQLVRGAQRSADRHSLTYELLDAPAIRKRFPALAPPDDVVGLLEPAAGLLKPEACITAALELAARAGAVLRTGVEVHSWSADRDGVHLETSEGRMTAGRLVLAAGAWLTPALARVDLGLVVERQVALWFDTRADRRFQVGGLPVFIWEWVPERLFYGLPSDGDGLKLARHHEGHIVDPGSVDRQVSEEDEQAVRQLASRYLPALNAPIRERAVCLYTNTRDHHFVIGPHPSEPRVLLASACSGHGFKFAIAVGQVLADLVTRGHTSFDLSPFRPDRLLPLT